MPIFLSITLSSLRLYTEPSHFTNTYLDCIFDSDELFKEYSRFFTISTAVLFVMGILFRLGLVSESLTPINTKIITTTPISIDKNNLFITRIICPILLKNKCYKNFITFNNSIPDIYISMITVEEKLNSFGYALSAITPPAGLYSPISSSGNLLFISGQIPLDTSVEPPVVKFKGKVGSTLPLEEGQEAARLCTLNALSHLKKYLGSLEKVKKIIKISGYVNCNDDFTEHPKVINGASELILGIFGEKGKHARIAVGMNSLPLNSAVEIDFIVEI